MALPRNLLSRRLHHSLTLHPTTPFSSSSLKTPPSPFRPITTCNDPIAPNPQILHDKKPLHALFVESVALNQKTETTPQEEEEEEEESKNSELKKNLRQLEEEVRMNLKGSGKVKLKKKEEDAVVRNTKRRSLFAVFTNKPDDDDDDGGDDDDDDDGGDDDDESGDSDAKQVRLLRKPVVLKELSPDMEVFVEFLLQNGYFNDANFAKVKKNFNLSWFDSFFARGYIKFAAQRFGRDNQEIAK